MSTTNNLTEEEKAIQQWKVKKLISRLQSARGNGTSMVSLIIPPKDQIVRYSKMLADEFGTAVNIKNRVNRLSVQSAITSARQKLKLYNKVPPNGLVIYCGRVETEDGKGRSVSIDFEPHRPINTSLYYCDSIFHTEPLNELLESDDRFGFVVVDGNGALFGALCGSTKEIIHKISVDLPKKHGRGGQSAQRFQRIGEEKRHHFLKKVAELCTQHYIDPQTHMPNVVGLVLAGSAQFKNKLSETDMLDPRLKEIVVKVVDVSYGGENGFNQAIEFCADDLANVRFVAEKRLIAKFFDEINQDTGMYVFGVQDTMSALDAGAVETMIVYENLEVNRYEVTTSAGISNVLYLTPEQERIASSFKDPSTGEEYEVGAKTQLVEWLAENYRSKGTNLRFISDKSQEGNQFVQGFGGIGGLLRYALRFEEVEEDSLSEDDYEMFY